MSSGKKLSRRDFLKASAAAGAGSLVAATEALGQISPLASTAPTELSRMPTRPFGNTGTAVSILGLGGMFDIPSNQLLLKQALKWGVTYWDTADCYGGGRSESGIGEFFGRYPHLRKQVFLVTKSDSRNAQGLTHLLQRSLQRMHTDYIDLYLIHGLRDIDELTRETRAWAERAKANGTIRWLGFSTHTNMENCLHGAARLGWIDGIMLSYNFRFLENRHMQSAIAECRRAGIGLTAMKTQGGGSIRMESRARSEMAERFMQQGMSEHQAKLKAVWENPAIASICSQMPTMTILMANIAAALNRIRLGTTDRQLLARYARETAGSYCAGCSQRCEPAMAEAFPVREVMRCLMYYHGHDDPERAKSLFASLAETVRRQLPAADFRAAESRCPQRLPIGNLMHHAEAILA